MPIFLRISSNSAAEVVAILRPLIQISPALGCSRPTRLRRSLLRPSTGRQPFQAAHRGDGDAEHHALYQAGCDVPQKQRLDRSPNVAHKTEIGLSNAEE